MPRDSAGTFVLLENADYPAVPGDTIESGAHNAQLEDFQSAFNVTPAQLQNIAWVDVASATTTDVGAALSSNLRITGTTTITSLGTVRSGITKTLRFAAALTLTHNATSLILPGGANIITAANDTAHVVSLGAGNWICINYKPASAAPLGPWTYIPVADAIDNTATLNAYEALAGVGGTPYLLNGTHIATGWSPALANQEIIFGGGAVLKSKAATVLDLLRIEGAGTSVMDAHIDGNYANVSDCAGINVAAGNVKLIRPNIYDTSGHGIYSDGAEGLEITDAKVTGQIKNGRYGIHYTMTASGATKNGPQIRGGTVDLTDNTQPTTLSGAVFISGNSAAWTVNGVVVDGMVIRMPEEPDTSGFGCLSAIYCDGASFDVVTEGGSMGLTQALSPNMTARVNAKNYNFYGIEVSESNNGSYVGTLEGGGLGLYGVAVQGGTPSVGNSFTGLNIRGSAGRTVDGSPVLGLGYYLQNQGNTTINGGTVNIEDGDYGIYAQTGDFIVSGTHFEGGSAGLKGLYTSNSGNWEIVGAHFAGFTEHDILAEQSTAGTLDNVLVVGCQFRSGLGGFRTATSGGGALGANIRIVGCSGFWLDSSSYPINACYDWASKILDVSGNGSPEGNVTAGVGSTYRRLNGTGVAALYFKLSGTGNTGWAPYYEEGAYTVTAAFATVGTSSFSYGNQAGVYRRVGNLVTIDVPLVFTPTIGTGSGDLRISLPIAAATPQNSTAFAISQISSQFTWPSTGGARTQLTIAPVQGTSYCVIYGLGSGLNPEAIAASHLTGAAAHSLRFSGSYRV